MQILQINNTSEEEGSLQCSSLVLHQWRFKNEKGPCYAFLVMSYCVTRTYLKDFNIIYDLISVESNRLLGIRIDSNRLDSSRFLKIFHLPAHLLATWLQVSRVPLNGLPVSRKSLILELTRIVFALRRFDSVWVYWTWVVKYGPQNWPIAARVLIERYNNGFSFDFLFGMLLHR